MVKDFEGRGVTALNQKLILLLTTFLESASGGGAIPVSTHRFVNRLADWYYRHMLCKAISMLTLRVWFDQSAREVVRMGFSEPKAHGESSKTKVASVSSIWCLALGQGACNSAAFSGLQ